MSKVFEVGKTYCRADSMFDPIVVVKRTAKTITCRGAYYHASPTFVHRIHVDEDGTEWVWDSYVPSRHIDSTVCKASWEVDE
jgi:hypothetical protein